MKRQLNAPSSPEIPFLYEVWNWVGDTSILPIKWFEFLRKVDKQTGLTAFTHLTKQALVEQYVNHPEFDPLGFFFITNRSDVAAAVLVMPLSSQECEFKEIAVAPPHRDKAVGEALLDLACNYAFNKGYSVAHCNPGQEAYTAGLLQSRGFF